MIEIKGYPGYYLADDELTIIGNRMAKELACQSIN